MRELSNSFVCAAVCTLDEVFTTRYADHGSFELVRDGSEYGFHLRSGERAVRFKGAAALVEIDGAEVQTFAIVELQKNILKNALVPRHAPTDTRHFTGRHPRALPSDPVCRLLGVDGGRLEISRDECVYYRDVS